MDQKNKCVICYMGGFDETEALLLLKEWKICKDHKKELKKKIKEIYMNSCTACGSDTVLKSGISKKTGKSYVGFKCTVCQNMDFPKTSYEKKQYKQNSHSHEPRVSNIQISNEQFIEINRKLDLILDHLNIQTDKKNVDETPF